MRRWVILGGTATVLVAAVLVALPFVARLIAVRRVEALTGRRTTIADADLNLFTRRIAFRDVRVAGPPGAPPLVEVPRIEARFRFFPLFSGRVHLDRLLLAEPAVHVVRSERGEVDLRDVIEHWRARPAGEPLRAALDALRVERARVSFVDHQVRPPARWQMQNVNVEAHNITTLSDAEAGRLSGTFAVDGGTGAVEVDGLRVRPFQAVARLRLDGIDIAPFNAYLPAAVRFGGGWFSSTLTAEYDAKGVVRAEAAGTLRDLTIMRAEQAAPFVTVPLVRLHGRDMIYADGALSVADVGMGAELATVLDASAPRARPLDVRDVRLTLQDARIPGARPGRLALSASLPDRGTLDAEGTGAIFPPTADVALEVRGVDVALAQIWVPRDAFVTPSAGTLNATASVRFAPASGVRVGGHAWITGLEMVRATSSTAVLRDDRLDVTVDELLAGDAGVRLGRLRLTASPTVLPGARTELHIPRMTLTATGGGSRPRATTHVDARLALAHGGRITVTGTAELAKTSAALTVVAADVDAAALAAPYVPRDAPVSIDRGRLDARLAVGWAGGLDVGGDATLRQLVVHRRGHTAPLVEHARLEAALTNLQVRDGQLSIQHVTLAGSPTIVDASVTPPQRFDLQSLRLSANEVTWPGRRPLRLEGHAETADGSRAALTGTLHPATLTTDVEVTFEGIDVARAGGYVPTSTPLTVEGGRTDGTVHVRHTRATGTRLDAEGTIHGLALTVDTHIPARVEDDRVEFRVDDLVVKPGAVAVDAVVVAGSPTVGHSSDSGTPFALRAELKGLAWPAGSPAAITLTARPGDGSIVVDGTFAPATRALEATARAEAAAIAPFAALLPVDAPVGGRLDGTLRATLVPDRDRPLRARGELTLSNAHVGPPDTAPIRADALHVEGTVEGRTVDLDRLVLTRPSVLLERENDGTFPLRAMLTPDTAGAASPREDDATAAGDAPRGAPGEWQVTIDDVAVREGTIRFLDRTTQPVYSEEIADLSVTVRDLSSVDRRPAGVTLTGIVGVDAALDLRGEVAPFASPFFLDVSGTLRDFSISRTNPYLRRVLDWIVRRGELTTRVHYRIVGDELNATNEILVHRLDIERTRGDADAERLIGVPLGLAVALLKDASGTIRFTLPVSGDLGSPTFDFGDAIRRALSNVLQRLVTAPLRAIGSVVRRAGEDDVAAEIEPATFSPGSAALTPDATAKLARLARVLRDRPYVRLDLQAVVSEQDLNALRSREVTARIQRVQREEHIDDFADAARRVWRLSLPGGPLPPDEPRAIIDTLAQREPAPTQRAAALAERRERAVRNELVNAGGFPQDRLRPQGGELRLDAHGAGRVEITLHPAS